MNEQMHRQKNIKKFKTSIQNKHIFQNKHVYFSNSTVTLKMPQGQTHTHKKLIMNVCRGCLSLSSCGIYNIQENVNVNVIETNF